MSTDESKMVLRRFTELVDRDQPRAIDEYTGPEFVAHLPMTPGPLDSEGFKQFAAGFYTALPDLHHEFEALIAEGDRVTGRFTMRGTHRGEFQGLPPTGNEITFGAIVMCRVDAGKLQEIWMQLDAVSLMQQLGAMPAAATAGN